MRSLGCLSVEAYLHELDKSGALRLDCERLHTVSISRFFRDRKLWEILEKAILPELVQKDEEKISAWSAGCASGEEVYSLKILWEQLRGSLSLLPELQITGTDLNPNYLERARAGLYPLSSLKEVPKGLRSVYFHKAAEGEHYAVKAEIRGGITWKPHCLLSDPPGSKFHLIFLRNNLLTYYKDELIRSPLGKVMGCLSDGGFLCIGGHEKLPYEAPDLMSFGSLSYVFRKRA